MTPLARSRVVVAALVAGFLVIAVVGQAGAGAVAPDPGGTTTGVAVGRAASSYLTGFRVVAAAALWNRAEPIMHRYYSEGGLGRQRYLLTSIAVAQSLDPRLVQTYYAGAWILILNERIAEAIEMSEEGVEANPQAGILWVNLAQLRQLYLGDDRGAVDAGMRVLEQETQWTDAVEMHNGYSILGAVFRQAGRADLDAVVQDRLIRLDAVAGDLLEGIDHDHDGDGVQDH